MKFLFCGLAALTAHSYLITKQPCYDDGYYTPPVKFIPPPTSIPYGPLPPLKKPPLHEDPTSYETNTFEETTSPRGSSPDVIPIKPPVPPPIYYKPIHPVYPTKYIYVPNPPPRDCDRSPGPKIVPLPVGPNIGPIFRPKPILIVPE